MLEGLTEEAKKKVFKEAPPERTQIIGDTWDVPRRELHTYLTPDFWKEYDEWAKYKRYGFRYTGGWAEQPAVYIDLLDIYEHEYIRWQNKRMNNASGRTKS